MKSYKKYFFILISMILTVFIICGAIVVYVDPFFHFHTPVEGFPYIVDNHLSQNPGMARNMAYNG